MGRQHLRPYLKDTLCVCHFGQRCLQCHAKITEDEGAFLLWDGNQCVIDIKSWPTTSTPTASSPTASASAMSAKGSSSTHQHRTEER